MNVSLVETEIKQLIKHFERDQCEKDIGNILKTTFLTCQYTDEGFADKVEFESKLSKHKVYLSKVTQEKMYNCIVSKKDNNKISFIKIKKVAEFLKANEKRVKDEYHAKDLMYGKITTKENFLDHPMINLIEIKMEEKYKNIHDSFRTFDTNGDR